MPSRLQLISLLLLPLLLPSALAATFAVVNRCPYTVWAAAIPGGGRRLDTGQSWTISVNSSTTGGRIWARTGCSFDGGGRGRCQTGDCGGALRCTAYGQPPNTLAEFALNQVGNLDYYDVSLVDGFNVPMGFGPTSAGSCRVVRCAADINGQCPAELRGPAGGCNNPCTVFRTDEYCCSNSGGSCLPTAYSRFFKERCPDAYSYPKDDPTSTFTCDGSANYTVEFCPPEHRSLRVSIKVIRLPTEAQIHQRNRPISLHHVSPPRPPPPLNCARGQDMAGVLLRRRRT